MDMYTLLHLKWIINKDLLHSICNCVQCYVAACMGGEFGGEWIHVYVYIYIYIYINIWLNPFAVHLKL